MRLALLLATAAHAQRRLLVIEYSRSARTDYGLAAALEQPRKREVKVVELDQPLRRRRKLEDLVHAAGGAGRVEPPPLDRPKRGRAHARAARGVALAARARLARAAPAPERLLEVGAGRVRDVKEYYSVQGHLVRQRG